MKAKTIYTDEYGEVVSCDDFDILQRSHNDLLEALESVIRLKALIDYPNNTKEKHIGEAMAISGMLAKVEDAIKKARGL